MPMYCGDDVGIECAVRRGAPVARQRSPSIYDKRRPVLLTLLAVLKRSSAAHWPVSR